MYKHFILFTIILCLLLSQASVYALSAKSSILIDGYSGRVIMENNAQQRLPMASTTKIMTALIALESGKLDDIVTISPSAANVEGSSMWLKAGENISLESLVYGLMLNSGNDAATAIAEYVGGDIPGFAKMMNDRAKQLGLKNTSFTNPHGLDNEMHYTTAYDLAQITRIALQNDKFAQIVSTKTKTISTEDEFKRYLKNHNKLLVMYEGADGVKTGFTKKSGRCLVSSATRDNLRLIAVTLNAPNDWEDHKEMLDFGFSKYRGEKVVSKNDYMRTVPVINGMSKTVSLLANKTAIVSLVDDESTHIEYDVPSRVLAPIVKGQKIGQVKVFIGTNMVSTVDLIAASNIQEMPRKSIWHKIKNIFSRK